MSRSRLVNKDGFYSNRPRIPMLSAIKQDNNLMPYLSVIMASKKLAAAGEMQMYTVTKIEHKPKHGWVCNTIEQQDIPISELAFLDEAYYLAYKYYYDRYMELLYEFNEREPEPIDFDIVEDHNTKYYVGELVYHKNSSWKQTTIKEIHIKLDGVFYILDGINELVPENMIVSKSEFLNKYLTRYRSLYQEYESKYKAEIQGQNINENT